MIGNGQSCLQDNLVGIVIFKGGIMGVHFLCTLKLWTEPKISLFFQFNMNSISESILMEMITLMYGMMWKHSSAIGYPLGYVNI